jgi:hypothetical protein
MIAFANTEELTNKIFHLTKMLDEAHIQIIKLKNDRDNCKKFYDIVTTQKTKDDQDS